MMRDYKNVPDVRVNTALDPEYKEALGQFKLDTGKSPVFKGFFQYFPRAVRAVADISQYGFEKYKEWGGWKKLYDAPNRYEDALARHQLDMAKGEKFDPESGKWHIAHRAWNAMATLELALIELENSMINYPRKDPKQPHPNEIMYREQMDPVPMKPTVDSKTWTGDLPTREDYPR